MPSAPVLTHRPCPRPECGSGDAAIVFADGGTFCYSCGQGTAGAGDHSSSPPDPSVPTGNGGPGLVPVEVEGFAKRGINRETCEKWGAGYGELHGERCQVYTYHDKAGRPVAQKLRFAGKRFQTVGDFTKVRLYGEHLWKPHTTWASSGRLVVVCEGEIDALTMSQVQALKWPVVSVPNGAGKGSAKSAIQRSLDWLGGYDKVVLMFDMDDVGKAAALECAEVLPPGKAYIAELPLKDPNEMLLAGRGKELVDAMWSARAYRPDGLIAGDEVWRRLKDRKAAAFADFPHTALNDKLMGVRPSEITVLVAGTGTGKTTAIKEWVTSWALAGHKVGYIGLEESVEVSALGLLTASVSRPLHLAGPEALDAPDVVGAWDRLKDRTVFYDHHGVSADANLLSKMRFMARGEGCKIIVLDHLSMVVAGMDIKDDERRTIDKMMRMLTQLVGETGVHVVAVCHLSRREGTPHEQGRPVTMADIRGSHGIAQMAFNIVSLERDQQAEQAHERNQSTVRVLKCRHSGRTGTAGYLSYNFETGRALEVHNALAANDFVDTDV